MGGELYAPYNLDNYITFSAGSVSNTFDRNLGVTS